MTLNHFVLLIQIMLKHGYRELIIHPLTQELMRVKRYVHSLYSKLHALVPQAAPALRMQLKAENCSLLLLLPGSRIIHLWKGTLTHRMVLAPFSSSRMIMQGSFCSSPSLSAFYFLLIFKCSFFVCVQRVSLVIYRFISGKPE